MGEITILILGVSKRALQLWKSIQMYTEDIHNVLNCQNVVNHCKFDSRNSVRPLLLHGDDHYRYRVSGHAPTVPHSTIRLRWPRRTHSLPARRRTPHYLEQVREYLNTHFPGRWIGRAAPIAWPPGSPDFFLWGFVKERVFVPPLHAKVAELRTQITAAVAEMTPETPRNVWQEIYYRWDVCRITNGSHIENSVCFAILWQIKTLYMCSE
jgi:hypothetical protein